MYRYCLLICLLCLNCTKINDFDPVERCDADDCPCIPRPGPDQACNEGIVRLVTIGDFTRIKAGKVTVGSVGGDTYPNATITPETVTLTHDFEILTTEVTQADFERLMGSSPVLSDSPELYPVYGVSWHKAAAYCNELSEEAGLDICYDCDRGECSAFNELSPRECKGYRLPTVAEWEYAARAGASTSTYNGNLVDDENAHEVLDPIAWYGNNSNNEAHQIATKLENRWALFDMLGNVDEWCEDKISDGTINYRGGNFGNPADHLFIANSNTDTPERSRGDHGFRPVRTLFGGNE